MEKLPTTRNRAMFYTRYIGVLFAKERIRARTISSGRGARHLSLGFRLRNPLQLDKALGLAEPLALHTSTEVVVAKREVIPGPNEQPIGVITYQFQLAAGYWKTYYRRDVAGLGVGIGEANKQIDYSFDPPHSLLAGTTGSGKTEAVKSILCALFSTYAPNALGAVIVDPHHDYEAFERAAHLVYPIAHDPDDIRQALAWAGQEMARRRDGNQRDGRRWLVVIDEATEVLADAQNLDIARRLAAEARKWRMHLCVATQKPTQTALPDLVDKLNNRWCGLVDNAQTSAHLTGHSGLQCHRLTGSGDFVRCIGPEVDRLQVALTTDPDLDRLPHADPPEVEPEAEDTPRVLNIPVDPPEPKGPGRPPIEIAPEVIGFYLADGGPDRVTRNMALEVLGLKRQAHEKHRDFARRVQAAIDELEANR